MIFVLFKANLIDASSGGAVMFRLVIGSVIIKELLQ
jgi:hypothetical protein